MAQSGYTPILIYASGTATNVPLAANMTSSASGAELALNYADGKLYYKNSSGVVTLLANTATVAPVTTFSAGTTGFTPSSATSGAVTLAGTLITSNGGTGLASYTAGDLSYFASGTALTKLAIGTAGQILTSSGTAPQWSTLSGVAVTTLSFGTTGLTPSTATSGAITVAGTLVVGNGGTGLTSLTANYIPYGNGTSAFSNSSIFQFNGTNLGVGAAPISTVRQYIKGTGATSSTWSLYVDNSTPTNIFAVRDDGYIGVGISTPSNLVTIQGDATGSSFADNAVAQLVIRGATSTVKRLGLGFDTTNNFGVIQAQNYGTGAYPLALNPAGGNVGIGTGTTAPAYRLDVRVTGTGNVANFQSDSGPNIRFTGTETSGRTYQIGEGLVTAGSFSIYDTTGSAERLVINSSGNLGLGVTPSAWRSLNNVMQIGNVTSLANINATSNSGFDLNSNNYADASGNTIYLISGCATTRYRQQAGNHYWYNAPSGTAGTTATLTQAMTLDTSGRLLVNSTYAGSFNGTVVANGQASIGSASYPGASVCDTGIPINQISAGGTLLFLCSVNASNGFSTASAVYMLQFAYDGNYVPNVTFISGSNSWTFSKSGSNTLTVTGPGGNANYAWFGNK